MLSLDGVTGLRDLKAGAKTPAATKPTAAPAVSSALDPAIIRWDTHISRNYIPWQRETPYPSKMQVPKAVADYQRKAPPLSVKYCGQFPNPLTVELCRNYTTAGSSEDRLCAARVWRGTDPATCEFRLKTSSGANDWCNGLRCSPSQCKDMFQAPKAEHGLRSKQACCV